MEGETSELAQEAMGICVDAHGGAIGMPQLCAEWFPNQIFWLVITLFALYFILTRLAVPQISAILAERAGTITHDLSAAEELKAKASVAEAAGEKVMADARAESIRAGQKARDEIQAELDAELAKADVEIKARTAESTKEIEAIRAEALDASVSVARDTAREIVAQFGTGADAKAVDRAIDQRMKG